MKRFLVFLLAVAMLLSGCEWGLKAFLERMEEYKKAETAVTTEPAESFVPETTETEAPETTEPPVPEHSSLYIPGLAVEDVILYFNEVVLDAEYITGGDPSKLQKWDKPIYYVIHGSFTRKDLEVLEGFVSFLNTIEGFPGMFETEDPTMVNLQIHFCSREQLINIMGPNFVGMDGGVTFWYDGFDRIYEGTICYCTEIDQTVRNSVILEEIYNGLGPVQDTDLRADSIIYAGYSEPQELTQIDELLLRLLYHPSMKCGMDREECEAVIRSLYY